MAAPHPTPEEELFQFLPLTARHLDEVVRVEQEAHAHPWSRRHFVDTLVAGYQSQLLCSADAVLGYFVAMKGVDEVHLLNVTVAPAHQGQGWGRALLDALAVWARAEGAQWLWLEARAGNLRALRVYESFGLRRVGERRDYYPGAQGQREDAVVMSLKL